MGDGGSGTVENPRRIGILGYGHLGKHLVDKIRETEGLKLIFVWNRTREALTNWIDEDLIMENITDLAEKNVDLVVEVCHPVIIQEYGDMILKHADLMIGSPTALADPKTEEKIKAAAKEHVIYIPCGAFWGADDIRKMADRKVIEELIVTMTKAPHSLKVTEELLPKMRSIDTEAVTLFEGPVRALCPLAPNNVNTMAVAAIAAHSLGFDKVIGKLIADPNMLEKHMIEIEVWGPGDKEEAFHVKTVRSNPALTGQVTGLATYASFFASLLGAYGKGPGGIHLC